MTVAAPFLRRSRVSRAERCENNYDAAFDVRETPFVTLWRRAPLAAPTSGLSSCSGTELARSRNLSSFRTCRGPRRAPPRSPRRRGAVPSSHRFPALRNQTRRSRSIFFSFVLNSVRDYDTLGFARFLREVFIYFLDVVSEPARLPKAKAPCMPPGVTAGVGSVSVNDLCPPASSVSSFKHPGQYLRFFPPALHRSVLRVLPWTEREKKS